MTDASAAPAPPRRAPVLASDIVRLTCALAAGIVAATIAVIIIACTSGLSDASWIVIALFTCSAASSLFYIVHTLWIFLRVDAPTLKAWLDASTPRGRFGRLGAELSGTGPTTAVQWSIIAIASVLLFTVFPGLLRDPVTVWLNIVVVGASWLVTMVAYAVHYARLNSAVGGLEYPGHGRLIFLDYIYLSVQVQTTFSTSDVSLTTSTARSIVTGHTLVSFAFNTVIIAMLITVLFLGH